MKNFRRKIKGEFTDVEELWILLAAACGFGLFLILWATGTIAPDFHDKVLLPFSFRILFRAFLIVWLVAAVILIYLMDRKAAVIKGIIAGILGFTAGAFLQYDWWYFYFSIPIVLVLPFGLWLARRNFWSRGLASASVILTAAALVMFWVMFTGFQVDQRWGVRLGAIPKPAVVSGFILAAAGAATGWTLLFALRTRLRNRAILADLIERDPRCERFFDAVLGTTVRISNEECGNRFRPAVEPVESLGPMWPKSVTLHRPFGLPFADRTCHFIASIPPVTWLARIFRPPLKGARLNSSLFRNLLNSAIEAERYAWTSRLFATGGEVEPTYRDERIVSLTLQGGEGPAVFRLGLESEVGSESGVAIPLSAGQGVEPRHCTIRVTAGELGGTNQLEDHSESGTWVNGVQACRQTVELPDDSLIQIGGVSYLFSDRTERIIDTAAQEIGRQMLAQLVSQDKDGRARMLRSAELHFARYVQLREAQAESAFSFGLDSGTEFDPVNEERINSLCERLRFGGESEPLPLPGLSVEEGRWDEVHEIYDELWLENCTRLFFTRGIAAVGGLPAAGGMEDPVDSRILTRNLLILRAHLGGPEPEPARCVADLALSLWLIEDEAVAVRIAETLDDWFRRLVPRMHREQEGVWEEVATALLPYLYWAGARNRWNNPALDPSQWYGCFADFIRFPEKIGGRLWGVVGNCFALAFDALREASREKPNQTTVRSKIDHAVPVFNACRDPLLKMLKLSFLAHVIRALGAAKN